MQVFIQVHVFTAMADLGIRRVRVANETLIETPPQEAHAPFYELETCFNGCCES